jgi:hypothetical protein
MIISLGFAEPNISQHDQVIFNTRQISDFIYAESFL